LGGVSQVGLGLQVFSGPLSGEGFGSSFNPAGVLIFDLYPGCCRNWLKLKPVEWKSLKNVIFLD